MSDRTYHLEGIELFFDLLGEHRSQAVASRYLTTAVVLATWPCVVKLDSRAERDIAIEGLRRDGHVLRVEAAKSIHGRKVVVIIVAVLNRD